MYNPSIIEKNGRSSKVFDLPTKLFQDRIIYLGSNINRESTNSIIMQLLWLNTNDPKKPIDLFINSRGGDVNNGLAIKDIIYTLKCKVNTIGTGECSSMAAYLLAAGTGERKTTKNCRIMIHSVSSGTIGKIQDMEIDYKEAKYIHEKILLDIAQFTKGKSSVKVLRNKINRDYYMTPDEAIKLGLIDFIM